MDNVYWWIGFFVGDHGDGMVAIRARLQRALAHLLSGFTWWPQAASGVRRRPQRFDEAQCPTPRRDRDWNAVSCALNPEQEHQHQRHQNDSYRHDRQDGNIHKECPRATKKQNSGENQDETLHVTYKAGGMPPSFAWASFFSGQLLRRFRPQLAAPFRITIHYRSPAADEPNNYYNHDNGSDYS